jgi:transcriptional regulator GlxA family with amidase domain
LRKVESLLKETDCKIGAVAEMCGYEDLRVFRRRFLAATGLPPGEWRRRCAGKDNREAPRPGSFMTADQRHE